MDFKGVYTALITPFTEYNTVDYASLERLVDFQIESGIDGLVPCGTTGESPTLSHEEHDRVISQTIKFASGKVPVIAGTGSNATSEAIRLSQHAQDAGVDAVLLVNPYYNKPTQKGMVEYFKAVASETDRPVVLYNVPSRTGANMTAETALELARIDNIIATKEASGDLDQIRRIIDGAPEGFTVLSGNDDQTLDIMKAGGSGVISVVSNIAPKIMADLVAAAAAGDYDTAARLNDRLAPLFRGCFIESNPIPVKAGLASMGLISNELRLPLVPSTPSTYAEMEKIISSLSL